MKHAIQWWRGRVELVGASPTLRIYGACLAAIHLLTFLYWSSSGATHRILSDRSPVCWPFFEGCAVGHGLAKSTITAVMWLYAAGAAVATIAFLRRRSVGPALALLTIVNLGKGAIFVLDYRFMGNYHYMPFVITFVYLAWPNPRRVIPYILVAFYVSAGSLKLDREWLSGAALIAPTWLGGKLLELACAYVALLELVIVLGLLSRRPWLRWAVFGQLVAFHAYSWHVVGFFYPCVMGLLLAFFPMSWREEPDQALGLELASGRAGWAVYTFIAIYAAAQVAPSLFPGDSAITGEGRIFALNMMDARVECDHFELVRMPTGREVVIEEKSERHPDTGLRIRCDPIRFWNIARDQCLERKHLTDEFRVDVYLNARRTTDASFRSVFAVENFCAQAPHFDIWRHNTWLEPRAP